MPRRQQGNAGPGQQSRPPSARKNPVVRQGRANYTALQAIVDGAPVLAGTFYILDQPASVLFDTRASHSFISTKCIKKHGFQFEQSG